VKEPMDSPNPDRKRPSAFVQQLSMAMELPFILIIGVLIGGGGGYFLDRAIHTSPVFTLVGGLLGFAAGMVDILRRLSRGEKNEKRGNG
jgi:F0F1-type ATP synthase assembly protein I